MSLSDLGVTDTTSLGMSDDTDDVRHLPGADVQRGTGYGQDWSDDDSSDESSTSTSSTESSESSESSTECTESSASTDVEPDVEPPPKKRKA